MTILVGLATAAVAAYLAVSGSGLLVDLAQRARARPR